MLARGASAAAIAVLLTATFAAADVVRLRDGTEISGRLTSCDGESCTIQRKRIEQTDIAQIILGDGPGPQIPPGTAPGAILTDGSIRPGPLKDVNLGYVSIGANDFDRDEVAAIILVPTPPAPPEEPPQPVAGTSSPPAEPPEPPSDPDPPVPAPAPAPAPPSPPAAPPLRPRYGAPDEPIRRGRLWTGQIIGRMWTVTADENMTLDVSLSVRLREYVRTILSDPPDSKKVAEFIFLNDEGSVVQNAYRSQSGPEFCSGSGESNPFSMPFGTWSSTIFRRIASGPMPALMQFDIPAGVGFYALASIPAASGLQTYQRTCVDGTRTSTYDMPYEVATAGRVPYEATMFIDPEMRHVENRRMFGSYSVYTPERVYQNASASWSICVERIDCPPPTPLDPQAPAGPGAPSDDDPCGRTGQQQAFADTCGLQLDSMVEGLEPLFAEYNDLMAAVNEDRDAFEAMQRYCLAYDIVQEILEAIITGGAGPAAKAAQALLHLRDLIEKVQSGSIAKEFLPEEVQKAIEIYEDAQAVWSDLTADDLTRMQGAVEECSGKAPLETYMAAKRFTENLAASRRLWESRVAPALNNIRGRGQECANLNHAAWRACIQDAECRSETANCGPEPTLHGAYDR